MPFTLSHAAAVVGLRRSGMPMAGLVVGSMVPDAPMFRIVPYSYHLSHSALGVVTVDLLTGTIVVALWSWLVAGALVAASPRRLRDRLPTARLTARPWRWVPVAVAVGAVTHVVWDAFTHEGRWGYRHLAWLRADHLGYAGFHWAQAASSAAGLVVSVVVAGWALARRTPERRPVAAPAVARWALTAVTVGTVMVALSAAAVAARDGLHAAAFAAAVHAATVLAAGLLIAGVVSRAAALRRPPVTRS